MGPGTRTLGGRYELRSLLATGGMGQVWRGRDTLLQRDVAVKVLRSEYTGDPTFLARFRAEAQHTAGLGHPNVATLFDYGEGVGDPAAGGEHLAWLVMELVEGESLSELLARESRLDPARTAGLLRQAAAGLGAAHAAGVVHRDVKPGNVLVAPDGTVKITDFGIARSAASVALTGTGQIVGTAHYLSPEQASGRPATPASDVYALGLVGYECLAGRRAFEGENSVRIALMQIQEEPPALPDDVPGELRALIGRTLQKDPARRFPDGTAFRAALDDVPATWGTGPAADRAATAVLPGASVPPPVTRVLPPLPPAGASAVVGAPPAAGPPAAAAPARRSWPRTVAALGAALALLAVVVVVLQGTGGRAPEEPGTTSEPTASAPAEDPTVTVTAEDHVGRPVGEVQADLARLGLAVRLRPVRTSDVPDGQVLAVSPTGALAPGSTVTVTHAVAPPPPATPAPDEDESNGDQGGGNGNEGGGNGNGGGANGNGGEGNGDEGGGNGNEGGGDGDEGGGNGTEGRDG